MSSPSPVTPSLKLVLFRWAAPLLAALSLLGLLFASAALNIRLESEGGGLGGLMTLALRTRPAQTFIFEVLFRELIPLYVAGGLLAWLLLLGSANLFPSTRSLRDQWTFLDGFLGTGAILGSLHLALWWDVPTTLWVVPFLNRLPYWLLFPCLVGLVLGPWTLLRMRRSTARSTGVAVILTFILGLGMMHLPTWLGALAKPTPPGKDRPARVLMVALDGLRRDTAQAQGLANLNGQHLDGMYAPVPATRMVYSLLWGGDPMRYTSSVVVPDLEELQGKVPLPLLMAARKQGWRTRFFIDDAGTIGIMGRGAAFDEVGMPAPGWESFFDSNFGAYVPFYASWLNRLRAFPGTHPWAPVDEGLKAALDRGRGADWVMYHSCLAHQPIFLTRKELGQMPRWWALSPRDYRPLQSASAYRPGMEQRWDSRMDPKRAYELRVQSILSAWTPLLNGLATDPDYRQGLRVFFSDHGEHFFRLVGDIRIQGTHGFHPDPIELGVPFVVSGPGIPEGKGDERSRTLLSMRTVLQKAMLPGWTPAQALESLQTDHPIHFRYVVPDLNTLIPMAKAYRVTAMSDMIRDIYIGPKGLWGMTLNTQVDERVTFPCVGTLDAQGHMVILKPLKDGGAHRLEYLRSDFLREDEVDEATYLKARDEAVAYIRRWTLDAGH